MGVPGNSLLKARREEKRVHLVQSRCPAVCKSTVSTFKKNFQGPVNANEMIQWGKFGNTPTTGILPGIDWPVARSLTGTGATSRLIE